jgi:hypothetical protein
MRISKKTQHFYAAGINWLMLFRKIIAVSYENYIKPINSVFGQNEKLIMENIFTIVF